MRKLALLIVASLAWLACSAFGQGAQMKMVIAFPPGGSAADRSLSPESDVFRLSSTRLVRGADVPPSAALHNLNPDARNMHRLRAQGAWLS